VKQKNIFRRIWLYIFKLRPLFIRPSQNSGRAENRFFFRHAIIDQAAVSLANFLAIVICAQLLSVPEQASFGACMAILFGVLIAGAAFAFAPVYMNDLSRKEGFEDNGFVGQIIFVVPLGAAFFLSIFALPFSLHFTYISRDLILALAVFVGIHGVADGGRRLSYVEQVNIAFGHSILILFLRISLLLAIRPDSAFSAVLTLALASTPAAAATILHMARRKCENFKGKLGQHIARTPFTLGSEMFKWVCAHLPVIVLAWHNPAFGAAALVSVRGISSAINVFLEMFETYFPAWLARRRANYGEKGLIEGSLRIALIGGVAWAASFAVIFLFGNQIVSGILGERYADLGGLLQLLWIVNGINFLARIVWVFRKLGGCRLCEALGTFSGALVVSVSLFLLPTLDLWSACCTLLAGQVVSAIVSAVVLKGHGRSATPPRI
jgi:hypothetical protein